MSKLTKTQEIKLMIIENYIDNFTTNDDERDTMKANALMYVEEDHVDEIEQSGMGMLPTEKQNVITRVRHLLCELDTDEEVVEAVRAIVNHKDQDAYVDWVDGIIVWDKVTNTFTCEEFLDEIEYYEGFENE
jgi:hypothetical protein